jgi:hypothetical protein
MSALCIDGFVYRPDEVRSHYPNTPPPMAPELVVCGFPSSNEGGPGKFADSLENFSGNPKLWTISSFELIGLWRRKTPLVLEHRPQRTIKNWEATGHEPMLRVPTRSVSHMEKEMLSKIENGASLVANHDSDGSTVQLLGAIRAKESCTTCHDAKAGALLGAFTYRIEPIEGLKPFHSPWPEQLR